jgi:lipopolysaccharide transport system ATP-binding protein
MSFEPAISVSHLSKCYHIYDKPSDRLKQIIVPRLARAVNKKDRTYFRQFWALNDVSFDIAKGETVGIVGRNGSGKSTLLQVICGTLNPTAGTVQANGRVAALLELGSGFNPEFTGRENVYMNGVLLGLSREEIDARYDDIVRFADIGDFVEQPVKTYSSGMLVRLAFAVAINADPEILIVDEALSVGDELFQRKCFSRIAAIKAMGATILFVSHSGGTVVELCDRAILLDSGEKLAVGSPKDIVAQYQTLLYAPPERRDAIRQEIKDGVRTGGKRPTSETGVAVVKSDRSEGGDVLERSDVGAGSDESEGEYDPGMVPSSVVAYESHGARIESPKVLTLDGRQVNILRKGQRYRYCYRVHFDSSATSVRFGMLIKTVSGVELGGAATASSLQTALPYISAGDIYDVEFSFKCVLNPGVYFMNAGVVGTVAGSETYLHRLLDIAMFRVENVPGLTATGIVDFGCISNTKLSNTTIQAI